MRFLTTTALALCLPGAALADDILLRADIAEALVFSEGADVTRRAELDIPAGSHRLLVPMRDLSDASLVEITGPDGVRIGTPQPSGALPIPEGALDTGAQASARAALEDAEDALEAARDALARRDAEIRGLETQIAWLTALSRGGQDGAAMPADPAQLSALLSALGSETARIGVALQTAREDRRADEDIVADRARDRDLALRALNDLGPFGPESPGIIVPVEADAAVTGTVTVSYPTQGAGWRTSYQLHLDSETESLTVERSIVLSERTPAVWTDVAVRFSTAIPNRRRVPAGVFPDPVRIGQPMPQPAVRSGLATGAVMDAMMEPAPAPETAQMVVNGLSITYDYATPVSVGPNGEVTLPLDDLSFAVDLTNRAIPRSDPTAFLVASGRNDTGEPILPGTARFYRDGDLVGSDFLQMIPPGGEVEMAFGPLDHLRLTWVDLSLDEGNRGIFVSENEQRRRVAFSVENTSETAETVRLIYAVPFAEQEDVEVDLAFTREPDETDIDDLRGVSAWDLDVGAGETVRIEMTVGLTWPDEMILDWRP
jgi:uncharacterized protein (TIGR02231 family)